MPTWLIVLLCAILAVGLFVLGMSLTLMIKGHNIDSEISTNKNMQKLGIKCAVHETREADGGADCSGSQPAGCSGNCGACDIEERRSSLLFYSLQNFDRQTNHGLRRSSSL